MSYDVNAVRQHFPALAHGTAYFDGPGGSQVPDVVAEAVAATMTSGISNRGTLTDAELRAERAVGAARQAMADLLGAQPAGVVFGRSMTALTYEFAAALARTWRPGDEIVLTLLDHDANVRPWEQAAASAGATVRWASFDPATGELPVDRIAGELSDRTRLVAVTAASNLLGTRPDIPAIAEAAHRVGARCYVDAVHAVPHLPVDLASSGADFLVCSPYKFCGPHLGVLAADPELLDRVHPDKLLPSPDTVPERFERGTLPYELLAGTTAAVDFLAGLAAGPGDRRTRLRAAMGLLEEHEDRLRRRLETGLDATGAVTRYSRATRRTPTVLFSVAGHEPREVARHLAQAGVNAPAGSFYAVGCARLLGLGDGGAVRAGIAPYTNESDVDRLVGAVAELAV
ncbi:MAG: cysteine desulfurase-like protein [Actinocatenispora sp.]